MSVTTTENVYELLIHSNVEEVQADESTVEVNSYVPCLLYIEVGVAGVKIVCAGTAIAR